MRQLISVLTFGEVQLFKEELNLFRKIEFSATRGLGQASHRRKQRIQNVISDKWYHSFDRVKVKDKSLITNQSIVKSSNPVAH
jgi:hypothetical protein